MYCIHSIFHLLLSYFSFILFVYFFLFMHTMPKNLGQNGNVDNATNPMKLCCIFVLTTPNEYAKCSSTTYVCMCLLLCDYCRHRGRHCCGHHHCCCFCRHMRIKYTCTCNNKPCVFAQIWTAFWGCTNGGQCNQYHR